MLQTVSSKLKENENKTKTTNHQDFNNGTYSIWSLENTYRSLAKWHGQQVASTIYVAMVVQIGYERLRGWVWGWGCEAGGVAMVVQILSKLIMHVSPSNQNLNYLKFWAILLIFENWSHDTDVRTKLGWLFRLNQNFSTSDLGYLGYHNILITIAI